MTVTTVGFGDVGAQNNAERLYMSFAMMVGGGLWAFILGGYRAIYFSFKWGAVNLGVGMDYIKTPQHPPKL